MTRFQRGALGFLATIAAGLIYVACSGCCVLEGSLVLTPSGLRPIEELQAGDTVLSYDLHTGQLVPNRVLETYTKVGLRYVETRFADGRTLGATTDHEAYDVARAAYREVGHVSAFLSVDAAGALLEGGFERETVYRPARFHDLRLEHEPRNYVANGVVVHNKGGGFIPVGATSQVAGTYNNVTGTMTDSGGNTVSFTSGSLVMAATSTFTFDFRGTTNEAGATNPIAAIGTGTVASGAGTGPFTGTYSGNYTDAGTIARVVTGTFTLSVAQTGLMTVTFQSGGAFQGTFSAQGPPPGSTGGGGGGAWATEAVVTTLTAGRLPRVTVDAAGTPHACSLDLTSSSQSYQYHLRTGAGTWSTTNIGSPVSACGSTVGEISDIGVQSNGTVHISFEVPDEVIRVASGGAGGFTLRSATTGICPFPGAQVDEAYAFVGHNALAVASTGRIYVAAWLTNTAGGGGARTLRVWESQSAANTEVELGGSGVGGFPDTRTGRSPSIAIGQGGTVHVSYEGFDTTLGQDLIRYARSNNNGNTWTTHTVANVGNGNDGWETRIAVDAAGFPHVVYYQPGVGYRQAISVDNGQTWTIDTVAAVSVGAGTAWIDIAIDANSRVHVVYNAGTNAAVTYRRSTNGVWGLAESVSTTGFNPSLAVHTDGTSHVVYRGASGGLFYSRRAP